MSGHYSATPVGSPQKTLCLPGGGLGWVAALLDRLDHMSTYDSMFGTWKDSEMKPADVLQRNFYFCAVEDPSSFVQAERIGVDHILMEEDYPHADSLWPRTQAVVHDSIGGLSPDLVRKFSWENASRLYRHPVPQSVIDDPNSF